MSEQAVSGRRNGPGPTAADEWRHVREVLAKRTPDSILTVNRYGMGINSLATGKAVTVLMRKEGDPNHAQVDRDLDALSILWNTADELLASLAHESRQRELAQLNMGLHIESFEAAYDAFEAERKRLDAELARERRRVAAYQEAVKELQGFIDWVLPPDGEMDNDVRVELERVAFAVSIADAPGRGGEGATDGR